MGQGASRFLGTQRPEQSRNSKEILMNALERFVILPVQHLVVYTNVRGSQHGCAPALAACTRTCAGLFIETLTMCFISHGNCASVFFLGAPIGRKRRQSHCSQLGLRSQYVKPSSWCTLINTDIDYKVISTHVPLRCPSMCLGLLMV